MCAPGTHQYDTGVSALNRPCAAPPEAPPLTRCKVEGAKVRATVPRASAPPPPRSTALPSCGNQPPTLEPQSDLEWAIRCGVQWWWSTCISLSPLFPTSMNCSHRDHGYGIE